MTDDLEILRLTYLVRIYDVQFRRDTFLCMLSNKAFFIAKLLYSLTIDCTQLVSSILSELDINKRIVIDRKERNRQREIG